jgi:hypothetical protein
MRTPAVFLLLVLTSVASAQHFSGATPVFGGSFGNVVFPGSTASTPGVTRFFGNVVFPSGVAPRVYLPNSPADPTRLSGTFGNSLGFVAANRGFVGSGFVSGGSGFRGSGRNGSRSGSVIAVPYAVPIYVGGYAGYTGYYDSPPPTDPGAAYGPGPAFGPGGPPQPNTIVVYPPTTPVPPGPPNGGYGETYAPPLGPPAANPDQGAATAPATYLIAFKDHTIYSAVAYWVEGDTLHYFTTGATHNQVSLSLVDRDLTLRLNQEAGNNMQLPNN